MALAQLDKETLEARGEALVERYGEHLVGRVVDIALKANEAEATLATAESLTAGGIAHLLAVIAPEVLACGHVTYNNTAKHDMLGVKRDTLDAHDAVSHAVAYEMAKGALQNSNAQIAVSATGFAGQWGRDDDRLTILPGTVFIGASCRGGETYVEGFTFDAHRTADIRQATLAAVEALDAAVDAYRDGNHPIFDPAEISPLANRVKKARERDPWLREIDSAHDAHQGAVTLLAGEEDSPLERYAPEKAGEQDDPLLQKEYGVDNLAAIRAFLDDAKAAGQRIAVAGGPEAAEICNMLTTLNGASHVVTRAFVIPDPAALHDKLEADTHLPGDEPAAALASRMLEISQPRARGEKQWAAAEAPSDCPTIALCTRRVSETEIALSCVHQTGWDKTRRVPLVSEPVTTFFTVNAGHAATRTVAEKALSQLNAALEEQQALAAAHRAI